MSRKYPPLTFASGCANSDALTSLTLRARKYDRRNAPGSSRDDSAMDAVICVAERRVALSSWLGEYTVEIGCFDLISAVTFHDARRSSDSLRGNTKSTRSPS